MTVHRLAPELGGTGLRFYFACPECGWCSPLRDGRDTAAADGAKHFMAKAAARDKGR